MGHQADVAFALLSLLLAGKTSFVVIPDSSKSVVAVVVGMCTTV